MRKVKLGLGHRHPGQSQALLVKGWWKSRSACWNCLKMRDGAEVCPWLSLEAQSPSERILKYLPLMSPVLKAGSSVLSASPSSRALVTFHRSELSQERVHSVAVSVTLKGPQGRPWGRKQRIPLKPGLLLGRAHYSLVWRFSEINPACAK